MTKEQKEKIEKARRTLVERELTFPEFIALVEDWNGKLSDNFTEILYELYLFICGPDDDELERQHDGSKPLVYGDAPPGK